MALDEFQVKLLQSIGEQALGKPMTHEAMSQLKGFINVVMDSYGVETPYATLNYTDGNGNIYSTTTLNDEWFDTSNYSYKRVLNDKHIASFVSTTEERIEEYIQYDFDKYHIIDLGSYVYQHIQEKVYDIATEVVQEMEKDFEITDEDSVVEKIVKEIDFESLYDLVEDILHAPVTMEEKLAEVGMSMKDFL